MKRPNDVKHLLTILIVLMLLFVAGVIWWASREADEQERLKDDVAALSVALEEAHEENPDEVEAPEDIIEDPPEFIHGEDGEDGQDGRPPTAIEIATAVEDWLSTNLEDQLDPNDPEIQDPEIQDLEIQDPDNADEEIQDPEIQDPEIQDEEVDDPDPGVESFTFTFDLPGNKTITVTCTDPDGDLTYSCVGVES